ncbi:hypothetical protein N7450_009314 [Penicillium hetheringtonii]|uniref:Uncharacterized protein n=1 Tax=Penicillium hetheringtonii TaxID=911720 RepID=A0AAD6GNE0_9EURO|nr:hypothetical protein N7450_009314 [Penicillium hetheringtonii]
MKRPFRVANGGLTAAIRSARGTRTRRLPAVQFQSAFEVMHMLHLPAVASAAAKAGAGLRRVNFNFSEEMETCETILSSEQGTPEIMIQLRTPVKADMLSLLHRNPSQHR